MDPQLLHRYRTGDTKAGRALESELRSYAETVLSHPDFQIENRDTRASLARSAARDAMPGSGDDLGSCLSRAIMTACRVGLEYVQSRGPQGGETTDHIPPGVLVSVALVPNAMAAPGLQAAEQHLASCGHCRNLVELVQDATALSTRSPTPEPDLANGSSTPAPPPAAEAPPDGPSAAGAETSPASATLTLDADTGSTEIPAASDRSADRRRRPPKPRFTSRVVDPRRADARTRGTSVGAWGGKTAGLLLALLALAYGTGLWRPDPESSTREALAALADRSVPALPPRTSWPPEAESAFNDLQLGECALAASRFHKVQLRHTGLEHLRYYEAVARICAGEGQEAAALLEDALEGVAEPSTVQKWYLAQAALLQGDAARARSLLLDVQMTSSPLRSRAEAQYEAIKRLAP